MENQKKGSKTILIILIILVLIIAGIFVYRNIAIKSARADAIATIEAFDSSKYDGDELKEIEIKVSETKEKLNSCKNKTEFQKILDDFNASVSDVKTTRQKQKEIDKQKAKEEAEKKAAEAAASIHESSSKKGSDANECVGDDAENFY